MITIIGLDQLRGNAQLGAGFAYAAFKDVCDFESLGDRGDILVLALELERGCAGCYPQARELGQCVEQFF